MTEAAVAPSGFRMKTGHVVTPSRRLDVSMRIDLEFHNNGKPCFVHTFVRRSLQSHQELHSIEQLHTGEEARSVPLCVPYRVDSGERLYFWVYADRKARGDFPADDELALDQKEVAGRARIAASKSESEAIAVSSGRDILVRHCTVMVGSGSCTIDEALMYREHGLDIPILDIRDRIIGHIWLSLPRDVGQSPLVAINNNVATSAREQSLKEQERRQRIRNVMEQYERELAAIDDADSGGFKSSNLPDAVPRRIAGGVPLPCGFYAPMWSMPWMLTQRVWDNERLEETLLVHLEAAESAQFTRFDQLQMSSAARSAKSQAVIAEFIAEMQLATVRSVMYTPDTVLARNATTGKVEDQKVDMWEYVNHQPDAATRRMDCEDGAIHVWEWHWLMRHEDSKFQDPRLRALQKFEQQYVACVTVGTMRTSESTPWFYHVWVMKFDRRYLNVLRGRSSALAKGESYLPPVLIESTTYTTSCWKYPDDAPPNFGGYGEMWRASQLMKPVENFSKTPASTVRSSGNYGAVLALIVPECMRESENKVVQFELAFNGKRCVPVEKLMDGVVDGIELRSVEISRDLLAQVRAVYDRMPPVPVLYTRGQTRKSDDEHKRSIFDAKTQKRVAFSAWYRYTDWQQVDTKRAAQVQSSLVVEWIERVFRVAGVGSDIVHVIGLSSKD